MVANVSLLVLLAAGVTAGFMGNWWTYRWIWVSLALLVVIGLSMTFVGARSLDRIRQVVQPGTVSTHSNQKIQQSLATSADEQLADLLGATHPVLLTVIGGGGLALILWLMMFKPF
jgi:thiol:disulfide interchange protein